MIATTFSHQIQLSMTGLISAVSTWLLCQLVLVAVIFMLAWTAASDSQIWPVFLAYLASMFVLPVAAYYFNPMRYWRQICGFATKNKLPLLVSAAIVCVVFFGNQYITNSLSFNMCRGYANAIEKNLPNGASWDTNFVRCLIN